MFLVCRRSRCRAVSPAPDCRSGCRSAVRIWVSRPCWRWRTPTSRPPPGICGDRNRYSKDDEGMVVGILVYDGTGVRAVAELSDAWSPEETRWLAGFDRAHAAHGRWQAGFLGRVVAREESALP